MSYRFLCPACLRDINPLFVVPPLRQESTCGHCGHHYLRTTPSIARAWANFFTVFTTLAAWVAFLVPSIDFDKGPAYCLGVAIGAFIVALLVAIPGRILGWLIGLGVGIGAGSPMETHVIDEKDLPKLPRIQTPPPPIPGTSVDAVRVSGRSSLSSTMRCWHCGHNFDVKGMMIGSQVRCPGCKAGLGSFDPSNARHA